MKVLMFSKILNLVKMDTEINTNMSKNELEIFIIEAHKYFSLNQIGKIKK